MSVLCEGLMSAGISALNRDEFTGECGNDRRHRMQWASEARVNEKGTRRGNPRGPCSSEISHARSPRPRLVTLFRPPRQNSAHINEITANQSLKCVQLNHTKRSPKVLYEPRRRPAPGSPAPQPPSQRQRPSRAGNGIDELGVAKRFLRADVETVDYRRKPTGGCEVWCVHEWG